MKDEKHTVFAVTEKELKIIWDCLDTTAEELMNDLNFLDLTNSSAIVLSSQHDAVIKLRLKIKEHLEGRL
jgi:RNAse (barnase) inhibitor barstar